MELIELAIVRSAKRESIVCWRCNGDDYLDPPGYWQTVFELI